MDFPTRLDEAAAAVEETLDRLLTPPGGLAPGEPVLWEAMRYSTLGGGKRLRGFLAVESAAILGADRESALRAGAAVECLHA